MAREGPLHLFAVILNAYYICANHGAFVRYIGIKWSERPRYCYWRKNIIVMPRLVVFLHIDTIPIRNAT